MNDAAILNGKKVLIVEDNQLNLLIAKRCLDSFGMIYSIATDGQSAITLLGQENFDVVLLDLNIPVLDGWEIASFIRSSAEKNQNTPIIVVSASEDPNLENKLKASKINAAIYKPYTPEQLKKALIENFVPVSSSI
ncbi:MAG TPA: response regulator [Bacteroidales bacterium]|nr:response regulator [Bacteroidales bacterium]